MSEKEKSKLGKANQVALKILKFFGYEMLEADAKVVGVENRRLPFATILAAILYAFISWGTLNKENTGAAFIAVLLNALSTFQIMTDLLRKSRNFTNEYMEVYFDESLSNAFDGAERCQRQKECKSKNVYQKRLDKYFYTIGVLSASGLISILYSYNIQGSEIIRNFFLYLYSVLFLCIPMTNTIVEQLAVIYLVET